MHIRPVHGVAAPDLTADSSLCVGACRLRHPSRAAASTRSRKELGSPAHENVGPRLNITAPAAPRPLRKARKASSRCSLAIPVHPHRARRESLPPEQLSRYHGFLSQSQLVTAPADLVNEQVALCPGAGQAVHIPLSLRVHDVRRPCQQTDLKSHQCCASLASVRKGPVEFGQILVAMGPMGIDLDQPFCNRALCRWRGFVCFWSLRQEFHETAGFIGHHIEPRKNGGATVTVTCSLNGRAWLCASPHESRSPPSSLKMLVYATCDDFRCPNTERHCASKKTGVDALHAADRHPRIHRRWSETRLARDAAAASSHNAMQATMQCTAMQRQRAGTQHKGVLRTRLNQDASWVRVP